MNRPFFFLLGLLACQQPAAQGTLDAYGARVRSDTRKKDYLSSEDILKSIFEYEAEHEMNGFHLLIHPGTSPERKDKLYLQLDLIIENLNNAGYRFSAFTRPM